MSEFAEREHGAHRGPHHGAEHGAQHGAAQRSHAPAAPSAPCPLPSAGGHGGGRRARGRAPGPWPQPGHGAPHGAAHGAGEAAWHTAETLVARLEEAGQTLLCLPPGGYSPRLRTSAWTVLNSAAEAYGTAPARLRPPVPPAARITRMDEALSWLALIPDDKYVLRRIVASRMLVSPHTGRHLFPWRRLATLLGADHKAIQRWHAQGIDMMVSAVNRK